MIGGFMGKVVLDMAMSLDGFIAGAIAAPDAIHLRFRVVNKEEA
jgi:hypothetical protein